MSHLITAQNASHETVARLEMGMCGPQRLAKTGYDLYGIYKAWHLDAGPSGTGDGVEVDAPTAWNAYEKAVTWGRTVWREAQESDTAKYCRTRADDLIGFTLAVFHAAEREKVFLHFL
jgi:hypothetical protein